jgi:hypothetical protein
MKDLYGTLIIFFYFVKYPLVIFLPIAYMYLNYENNYIMNALWIVSVMLILKDWFYNKKEQD